MIPSGSYVALAVVAAAVLAWLLARILLLTRHGRTDQATRLARTGTVVWAIGLLVATLRGSPPMDYGERPIFVLVPFAGHNEVLDYEIVLNCFLFTPLALLLPWATRWAAARTISASTTLAFGASVLIELIQAFTPLGIAADITDVLLNTTGCLLASLPAALLYRFTLPRRPVAEAEISPDGSPPDPSGGSVGSVTVSVVEPPFGGDQ